MNVAPDIQHALSRAKIQLMASPDSAFFTTVCFSLKHVWDDRIPTACTDGKTIHFNPTFFVSLSVEEQIFLMLHETLHAAYTHMLRLGGRDHARFNMACDYVINLQLVKRGFKMPKCGLLDYAYDNMSAEQVYDLLSVVPPSDYEMDLVPGDGDPTKDEQLSQDIQDILVRAKIQSKLSGDKPGTIPGDIEVFLDELLNPKLPWNKILIKHLHAKAKDDFSFRRPNRRFFPRYHMPSLFSEKLMNMAAAVDISGSVSDHEFKITVGEVASIFRMMTPERIDLLQFDTEIKSVDRIKSIRELMNVKFTGRGGTLIEPVLEWANANKPELLLIFSDGGFSFPELTTKVDTIWLIHNNDHFTAPFGKVIHYTI